jgi:hypothetical protein
MADQSPKSTAGPSKQAPKALFEDMSKYFDKKHIFDGLMRSSSDKHGLLDSIHDAFDVDAFAAAMFRDLRANLKGNMFSNQPAMGALKECFHEQNLIDGICDFFGNQHLNDGIGDAFDKNAFAGDLISAVAQLTGDSKKSASTTDDDDDDAVRHVIATKLIEVMFSKQSAVEVSTIDQETQESVPAESKAAVADFHPTISMDATAVRQQTIGSLPDITSCIHVR